MVSCYPLGGFGCLAFMCLFLAGGDWVREVCVLLVWGFGLGLRFCFGF